MPAHGFVHADNPTMGETKQDTHRRTLQTRNLLRMPEGRHVILTMSAADSLWMEGVLYHRRRMVSNNGNGCDGGTSFPT